MSGRVGSTRLPRPQRLVGALSPQLRVPPGSPVGRSPQGWPSCTLPRPRLPPVSAAPEAGASGPCRPIAPSRTTWSGPATRKPRRPRVPPAVDLQECPEVGGGTPPTGARHEPSHGRRTAPRTWYSLQANLNTLYLTHHPYLYSQFAHLNVKVQAALHTGTPSSPWVPRRSSSFSTSITLCFSLTLPLNLCPCLFRSHHPCALSCDSLFSL